LIVLDDADLDQAVDATAFGAFMNQGQICMSTERIVVDDAVADTFVAKLAAKASHLPAGDPRGHLSWTEIGLWILSVAGVPVVATTIGRFSARGNARSDSVSSRAVVPSGFKDRLDRVIFLDSRVGGALGRVGGPGQ
jgi:hypothetical protein